MTNSLYIYIISTDATISHWSYNNYTAEETIVNSSFRVIHDARKTVQIFIDISCKYSLANNCPNVFVRTNRQFHQSSIDCLRCVDKIIIYSCTKCITREKTSFLRSMTYLSPCTILYIVQPVYDCTTVRAFNSLGLLRERWLLYKSCKLEMFIKGTHTNDAFTFYVLYVLCTNPRTDYLHCYNDMSTMAML